MVRKMAESETETKEAQTGCALVSFFLRVTFVNRVKFLTVNCQYRYQLTFSFVRARVLSDFVCVAFRP